MEGWTDGWTGPWTDGDERPDGWLDGRRIGALPWTQQAKIPVPAGVGRCLMALAGHEDSTCLG